MLSLQSSVVAPLWPSLSPPVWLAPTTAMPSRPISSCPMVAPRLVQAVPLSWRDIGAICWVGVVAVMAAWPPLDPPPMYVMLLTPDAVMASFATSSSVSEPFKLSWAFACAAAPTPTRNAAPAKNFLVLMRDPPVVLFAIRVERVEGWPSSPLGAWQCSGHGAHLRLHCGKRICNGSDRPIPRKRLR